MDTTEECGNHNWITLQSFLILHSSDPVKVILGMEEACSIVLDEILFIFVLELLLEVLGASWDVLTMRVVLLAAVPGTRGERGRDGRAGEGEARESEMVR